MSTTNLEQTISKLKQVNPAIEEQYNMEVVKEKDHSVLHFRLKGYPPRTIHKEKRKHLQFSFFGIKLIL